MSPYRQIIEMTTGYILKNYAPIKINEILIPFSRKLEKEHKIK